MIEREMPRRIDRRTRRSDASRDLVAHVNRGGDMRIAMWTTGPGEATLLVADSCVERAAADDKRRRQVKLLWIDPKGNSRPSSRPRPGVPTYRA